MQETWDMERIFAGGSDSPALNQLIQTEEKNITTLASALDDWDGKNAEALIDIIKQIEAITQAISEANTFLGGLYSADTSDQTAAMKLNTMTILATRLEHLSTRLQKSLGQMSSIDFDALFDHMALKKRQFPLTEMRQEAQKLLSTDEEQLISELAVDGFQGWGEMYDDLVSTLKFPFQVANDTKILSAGQAENNMHAAPTVKERAEKLAIWENTWHDHASLFSRIFNHLTGFRLTDYKLHHYTDYMEKPLTYNRMKQETLDTMWETIAKNKQPLVDFLNRKAQLLQVDQLGWLDVDAAVTLGDFEEKKYSYEEAAQFIVKHFTSFSPKMAQMAQKAFDNHWIEAEDRPSKRPGGYCADLPLTGESRIFMTFSGSADNVSTLAHELGHAFHSHVMRDLPAMNQNYAMNVAETASTFAEQIVNDATIAESTNELEKINLLNTKICLAISMMMNIHARYIFERSYHDERQKGFVSPQRLSELMLAAQKEAYENSLSTYHPMFWAAKLHFYITDVPFYNFPYAFGYFFSQGIYAEALKSESGFEKEYIALLRDTASMTTEELAQKHLGVDLTKEDFWQSAIQLVHRDIEEFMTLTEKYI